MKRPFNKRLILLVAISGQALIGLSQSISGVVNSYYKVTAVNAVTDVLTLTSTAGLSPGNRILIIQMKGATMDSTNSASFGNIITSNQAGIYEFNTVCGISGNDLLLRSELLRTYDPAGLVQVVAVPRYTSVTVVDTVRAATWNASTGTGGVIAIEASDTIFLNSAIDASGRGFAGGPITNYPTPTYDCVWTTDVTNYFLGLPATPNLYYTGGNKGEGIAAYGVNKLYARGKQVNGGGGGNNHNTGGAGGANYGTGGNGGRRSNESAFNCHGQNPGIGGLSLSTSGYTVGNNRLFMGGGGGSGHMNNNKGLPGGNGGGIIILVANVISSAGNRLMANGARPSNSLCFDPLQAEGDGGGGGGGGGTIALQVNQVSGSLIAEARGGNGSNSSHDSPPIADCTGPGGGGGGGVVWASAPIFPANITAVVSGGANGTVSMSSGTAACRGLANGATSGAAGASLVNYSRPLATLFTCAPLAVNELKFFRGKINNDQNTVWWSLYTTSGLEQYFVERSIDQLRYETISVKNNNGSIDYTVNDTNPLEGTTYYRLKLVYSNGTVAYSEVISVRRPGNSLLKWIRLSPNPVNQQLRVQYYSEIDVQAQIKVFDATGRRMLLLPSRLSRGLSTLVIPVEPLPAGIYWITMEAGSLRQTAKFVKQ